jgi:peptidyl-tRNA hydrolase
MDMQDPLVQPIAVLRSKGSHEDVVVAVALASVQALLADRDNPAWAHWLSGKFTKSVRRGTQSQMDACRDKALSIVKVGDVEAMGFLPSHYLDMPDAMRKMQVSHFERPRASEDGFFYTSSPWPPAIWVNEDVGMSTGKTAAQVAHGLMGWVLRQDDLIEWMQQGCPFSLFGATREEFNDKLGIASVLIEDAGLTEIASGTATVLAIG